MRDSVFLEENRMQAVCCHKLFALPDHHESRSEALRVHKAVNPAEARLGWRFFCYGLAASAAMLLGASFFTL